MVPPQKKLGRVTLIYCRMNLSNLIAIQGSDEAHVKNLNFFVSDKCGMFKINARRLLLCLLL